MINKTRKLCGSLFLNKEIGDAINALALARNFVDTYPKNLPEGEAAECSKLRERYAVAIRTLGLHMLKQIESTYAPIEYTVNATINKEFTVPGENEADALDKVSTTVKKLGGKVIEATAKEKEDL